MIKFFLLIFLLPLLANANPRTLVADQIQSSDLTKLWLMPTVSGTMVTSTQVQTPLPSFTNHGVLLGTGAPGGINATAVGIAGQTLTSNGPGLDPTFQTPGSGVTTMGAFGATPNANGGTIAGVTLTLQPADNTHPGGVSTLAQTFGGAKTFSTAPIFSSLTNGSVPYIGVGGQLSEDNANFFWDAINHRLGVGTTTPNDSVEISSPALGGGGGSSSEILRLTTPDGNNDIIDMFKFRYAGGGDWTTVSTYFREYVDGTPMGYIAFNPAGGAGGMAFGSWMGGEVFRFNQSGGVGINTTTPMSELDVKGGVAIGAYAGVTAAPANSLIVSGSIGAGNSAPTNSLDMGTAGTVAGTYSVSGATSGTITFLPQAAAGTYNWNWPTTAGTVGQVLTSGGGAGAPMTWAAALTSALTNAHIFVGNAGNMATDVAVSGDLTLANTGAFTFNTVNGNVGTFGSSTSIPTFTVNAKGLITAASGNAVIAPAGTLSGATLNATVVNSSLTSVGTLTSGTWNGSTITVPFGGTGATTETVHGVLLGQGAGAFTATSAGVAGQVLTSNGPAADPTYQAAASGTVTTTGAPASGNLTKFSGATSVTNGDLSGDVTTSGTLVTTIAAIQGTTVSGTTGSGNVVFSTSPTLVTPALGTPSALVLTNATGLPLTTGVTGILPVANGGTGANTLSANGVVLGQGVGAVHVTGAGTAGQVLTSNGAGVDPTFQPASSGSFTQPTVQQFVNGASGTYTKPVGVLYLRLVMCGGGGSGGSDTGNGNSGTDSTFGAAFLDAGGGNGGHRASSGANGGSGGGAAVVAPAIGEAYNGSAGGSSGSSSISTVSFAGGAGGGPAGGRGGANTGAAGSNGGQGGSGGGGAGNNNGATDFGGGGGGGQGACLNVLIPSPSATYAYAAGTGGAASAGTTFASGSGGPGIITVYEYYQ